MKYKQAHKYSLDIKIQSLNEEKIAICSDYNSKIAQGFRNLSINEFSLSFSNNTNFLCFRKIAWYRL
jgi:hypothetical protein